jgi:hypothetical protein
LRIVGCEATRFQQGQIGADGLRQAKQHQRLIDQMRAQILPDTSAALILPTGADPDAQPVKMAVEFDDIAKLPAFDQVLQSQEIGIPPSVVKNRQQRTALPCPFGNTPGFGQRRGKRLVDHDMLACLDGGEGLFSMEMIGRGQHNQCHRRIGQHLGIVHAGGGSRIAGVHLVMSRSHDGAQVQTVGMRDQRGMKRLARQTEPNQCSAGHEVSR